MNKRQELEQLQAELGSLPMSIDRIIELESMGYVVNLETGKVTRDTDTFTLTPSGEAYAIILESGLLDE
jgi:hypothetical protein